MTDTEVQPLPQQPLPPELAGSTPPDLGEDVMQEDYFAVDETFRCILPDGKSWVETKAFTEGDRTKYVSKTNRDVRMSRATQEMHFALPGGEERAALLEIAMVDWNLVSRNKNGELVPVRFDSGSVKRFLTHAKPDTIDHIEKHIRSHERWLMAEVTVEDIDRQIEDLQRMREQKEKEEAGNVSSSAK